MTELPVFLWGTGSFASVASGLEVGTRWGHHHAPAVAADHLGIDQRQNAECTRMSALSGLIDRRRALRNPWPSPRSVLHVGQLRLPIHAQGAVQRISGAGLADEVGGRTNRTRGAVRRQPSTWISGWGLAAGRRCRVGVSRDPRDSRFWPHPATGKVWSALRPGRNRVCTGSGSDSPRVTRHP